MKNKRTKNSERGGLTMTILIGIVIIGAVVLTGGIFPSHKAFILPENQNIVAQLKPNQDPGSWQGNGNGGNSNGNGGNNGGSNGGNNGGFGGNNGSGNGNGGNGGSGGGSNGGSAGNNGGSGTTNKRLELKTIQFESCSQTVAVDMELDTSDSMNCSLNDNTYYGQCTNTNTRIDALKSSVNAFLNNLGDNALIGIQTFNSNNPTNVLVPVSYYKDVKNNISQRINSLRASGSTPTVIAFRFARDILTQAQTQYPERKFALIFVSDGLPYPTYQDPRLYSPNPIDEIKNLGVHIYAIAVGQELIGNQLMRDIASSPQDAFNAPTSDQLTQIYQQISSQICSDL